MYDNKERKLIKLKPLYHSPLSLLLTSIQQTMLPRIAHQLHSTPQAQFGHQVGAVLFDGLPADVQNLCRMAVGVALGDEAQDLDLLRGQHFCGFLARDGGGATASFGGETPAMAGWTYTSPLWTV